MWTRGHEDKECAPDVQCTVKLSQAATKKSDVTVINMTVHRRSHMAPKKYCGAFWASRYFRNCGFAAVALCVHRDMSRFTPPPQTQTPTPRVARKLYPSLMWFTVRTNMWYGHEDQRGTWCAPHVMQGAL